MEETFERSLTSLKEHIDNAHMKMVLHIQSIETQQDSTQANTKRWVSEITEHIEQLKKENDVLRRSMAKIPNTKVSSLQIAEENKAPAPEPQALVCAFQNVWSKASEN